MRVALEVFKLSVVLDHTTILQDVSFEVPEGKIVGLLGPSGSGKTTLIKTILHLQKPSQGGIRVLGHLAGAKFLRSKVGYVSQSASVYDDLTVYQNVHYFATLLGLGSDEINRVITNVELDDFRDQLVANLSGGQKARVSLAVALLGKPRVLLLDEPTVGLDPVLRQKLWDQFAALARSGTTLLISSHVMDEAERCDELLFLRQGKLLISGTKKSILAHTKTKTIQDAFLQLAKEPVL